MLASDWVRMKELAMTDVIDRLIEMGREWVKTPPHEELGVFKGKAYRSITRDVIKRIEKRLANIDWTIPDDEKKLAERKGKTSVKDG